MNASLWMLLRPLGAMNGCRGGLLTPRTGRGVAALPSNSGTLALGSCGMGVTGEPGVWAGDGVAAQAQIAAPATPIVSAPVPGRIPKPRLPGWVRSVT